MAKTRRLLTEHIKLVDVVIELLDARIPRSSRNPDIDALARGKKRIVVLNKADLSDDRSNSIWKSYYEAMGFTVVVSAFNSGKGIAEIEVKSRELTKERTERLRAKGVLFVPVRAMIVGIPNAGKSTLINRYIKKPVAKAEDRPGVTRGTQWIRIKKDFELLDTPGVLWPKFDDPVVGRNLAYTGAITDRIMDIVSLARNLADDMRKLYPDALTNRYNINTDDENGILEAVGKARGYLKKGGEIDLERTAVMLVDEFRGGKLGKICLEQP